MRHSDQLMQVKKIDTVKAVLLLNSKLANAFDWGDCVMIGQTIIERLNDGVELNKAEPKKIQRHATARKIGNMIRKCKAETKALKKLDDEQKEYLERMRRRS